MVKTRRMYAISLSAVLLLTGSVVLLMSQTTGRELIHDQVDESKLATLTGNTRPEANAANDLGVVADNFSMDHMMLQLKRSPRQEKEVEQFIADLHDPQSPNFHKWLSAEEFGKKFGLAESDLRTVTNWLESHRFTVNSVYPSGMVIDFSGNAGQVRNAFHTSIHNLNVGGVHHIANFGDPQIPAALAPAVAGVVSLHDFRPHNMARARKTGIDPLYTYTLNGAVYQAVVPADLAVIYDFNPLFNATHPITGTGQTIAVLEDSDLYRTSDWTTFRSAFGLSAYTSGTLTAAHPAPASGTNNCSPPGFNADDAEAILDAEWASAAAPGATIEVAACASTAATFGVFTAGQNLVNSSAPPAIISISYTGCETENGASTNSAINSLYQQAVTEGISLFVAAGDSGAASCDQNETTVTHGIGVNAYAATQYNVAVGGTDFADVLDGTTSQYWSSNNTTTYGSAIKYVPEIPWNNSCAGSLFAGYNGYSTVYGANGFCNSSFAVQNGFQTVAAGGGGPSNCFSGAPSLLGIADGTCQGYPKPSWQTGLAGIPGDGVRDIPDVSMFASDGQDWGRYAVVCYTDPSNGGTPCKGAPSNWAGFGGTSLAAPVMAGIQALVNQSQGAKQGNPNTVYYALAAKVPTAFHAITRGDIDQICSGPYNCYGYIGTVDYGRGGRIFGTTYGGALSVSDTTFTPAYGTGGSWNFSNGIGSVDVNVLVTNWPK